MRYTPLNKLTKMQKMDSLDLKIFFNGLVFFAPVALLVRTMAGVSVSQFFFLQAILSFVIFALEIPAGTFTDIFGYKNTMVLNQIMLFLARLFLLIAFMKKNFLLFLIETVLEGIAACLNSGTESAYVYTMFPNDSYVVKMARMRNCGTLGFIISTISYSLLYSLFGIEGLLFATVITSFLGIIASFQIPREVTLQKREKKREKNSVSKKAFIMDLFQKKTLFIVLILSAMSVGRILINFFYVEKLLLCNIQEEWMSLIILGYSIIELFAEKILCHIPSKSFRFYLSAFLVVSGLSMISFGILDRVGPIIILMLVMPLLLDVPSCILEDVQNKFVDSLGQENRRAEMLSIFNMGINIFEIIFLFASSAISNMGIVMCFVGIGGIMILMGYLSNRILSKE